MIAPESTERPPEPKGIPLEYPPREIARIYAARLGFLLFTLVSLTGVMLVLYGVARAVADQRVDLALAALAGALLGFLGQPGTRARLRARVRGLAADAGLPPMGHGTHRQRAG